MTMPPDRSTMALQLGLQAYSLAIGAVSAVAVVATTIGALIGVVTFSGQPSWNGGLLTAWMFCALCIAIRNTASAPRLVNKPDARKHLEILALSAVVLLTLGGLIILGVTQ